MGNDGIVFIFIVALAVAAFFIIGMPQPIKGVAITAWDTDGYQNTDQIDYAKSIGANYIQLTPTSYLQTVSSTQIKNTEKTASKTSLKVAIDYAHSKGLKVLLKPHIDIEDGTWRGNIQPSQAFKDNYYAWMMDYAAFAHENQVEMLSVGTELKGMEGQTEFWENVIDDARYYAKDAQITYAANWDSYQQVNFWHKTDFIGVDAYFPVQNGWNETISQLRHNSQVFGKKVLFTEIGYQSKEGALATPYGANGYYNEEVQRQAYQQAREALKGQSWLEGVFLWDIQYNGIDHDNYSWKGKPAEDEVRRWFE